MSLTFKQEVPDELICPCCQEVFSAPTRVPCSHVFCKKCLDVSVETQYVEGEANAYKGLGICEKKVLNIFNAMGNLETALEKAIESEVVRIQKDISTQLVLVYQEIAL